MELVVICMACNREEHDYCDGDDCDCRTCTLLADDSVMDRQGFWNYSRPPARSGNPGRTRRPT